LVAFIWISPLRFDLVPETAACDCQPLDIQGEEFLFPQGSERGRLVLLEREILRTAALLANLALQRRLVPHNSVPRRLLLGVPHGHSLGVVLVRRRTRAVLVGSSSRLRVQLRQLRLQLSVVQD